MNNGNNGIFITTISEIYNISLMWVKQCHKPPMTGNGNHTTLMTGGWFIVVLPTLYCTGGYGRKHVFFLMTTAEWGHLQ